MMEERKQRALVLIMVNKLTRKIIVYAGIRKQKEKLSGS